MRIVVVGAGGIGQSIAQRLGERGHEVVLASRSGRGIAGVIGSAGPTVSAATVDASDPAALAQLVDGAGVVVNAVNPPYTQWASLWPPMAQSFLQAAAASGAALLTVSNLYGYGHVDAPMTERTPLASDGVKGQVRAQMWRQALEADRAGRVRVAEVRASDYFGPGAGAGVSYLNQYAIRPAVQGRRARFIVGDLDAPHSWTYLADIGALAAAIAEADTGGDAWGRPWHVPTAEPRSLRQVVADAASAAGVSAPEPRVYPSWVRRAIAVGVPVVRELGETAHQFEKPFVLDSSDAERRFALTPTAWDEAVSATVAWLRASA